MPLTRVSCQQSTSLDQDYRDYAALPASDLLSRVGEQMLRLLPLLSELCAARDVWALTSHAQLCLLRADDEESPWLVKIDALPWGGFEVQYLLPAAEAPWPGAAVSGYARDETAAADMIRIAMGRSGAWA